MQQYCSLLVTFDTIESVFIPLGNSRPSGPVPVPPRAGQARWLSGTDLLVEEEE